MLDPGFGQPVKLFQYRVHMAAFWETKNDAGRSVLEFLESIRVSEECQTMLQVISTNHGYTCNSF